MLLGAKASQRRQQGIAAITRLPIALQPEQEVALDLIISRTSSTKEEPSFKKKV
jgi:hypothetical protein